MYSRNTSQYLIECTSYIAAPYPAARGPPGHDEGVQQPAHPEHDAEGVHDALHRRGRRDDRAEQRDVPDLASKATISLATISHGIRSGFESSWRKHVDQTQSDHARYRKR